MAKISSRQLYFLLACVMPVGKLIVLPVRLALHAGNDLWLPTLLLYLLSATAVFCVLLLAKRNTDLYTLLSRTLGRVAASVLMLLLALFLLLAALIPLLEQKLFVQGVFYDTLPSLAAFSPFFLFSAYYCSKPLCSTGRLFDLLGPISVVAVAGVLLLSVSNADYGAMLPIGASGAKGMLKAASVAAIWFFDPALLLLYLGKLEDRKGLALKGALFYLLGGAAVLFFLITFYGIFEGTAMNQLFAFTKTSKYYSAVTVLGRVDYLFIFALSLVMTFYAALPLQCAVESCLLTFGRKKYLPTLLSLGFNALYLLLDFLFDYRFGDILEVFGRLFWIFPLFALLLPPLLLFLGRRHAGT